LSPASRGCAVDDPAPDRHCHRDFTAFSALFGIRPDVGQALTVSLGDRTLTLGWAHCPLTTETTEITP
jgi:hypothetical protein